MKLNLFSKFHVHLFSNQSEDYFTVPIDKKSTFSPLLPTFKVLFSEFVDKTDILLETLPNTVSSGTLKVK